jgi:membrane-associated protease RseP (regulator of RpoE activity)
VPVWLLYTLGVVVFAFGLLFSIALHEIGHMVPAKKFGVKVTQYMVGFGPTIWSRKRGDTEYGIKAIPLGGYIRMIGMIPPRADGKVSRWPRRMASAIEDFRQTSRAEIDPADDERQFYRLTPGKKMIVMLGGPSMNLLIYLFLTVIMLSAIGTPQSKSTTTIQAVIKCVAPVTSPEAKQNDCVRPNAPAYVSGLRPGDKIVTINGAVTTTWADATKVIRASPGKELSVVVDRAGIDRTIEITPVDNLNYVNSNSSKTEVVGYIGIEPGSHNYYQTYGITGIPGQIATQVRQGWDRLMSYPARIGNLFGTIFNGEKRNPNGAIGVVGISRITGDIVSSHQIDVRDKILFFGEILASVNLLLFFFNLLPLLPLDGGHVAGAIVEATKRGRARLRLRRNPHPVGPDGVPIDGQRVRRQIFVDTAQLLPVMYVVASLLVVLTLLTLYADIVDPINPLSG